jgi:hypothetical protein
MLRFKWKIYLKMKNANNQRLLKIISHKNILCIPKYEDKIWYYFM